MNMDMLTSKQVAEILNYKDTGRVIELIKSKKLPGYKFGYNTYRVRAEDLQSYINQHKINI